MGEREEELKDMIDSVDDAKPEIEGDEGSPVKEKEKVRGYLITEEMMEKEKEIISNLNFLALAQYKREIKQQIADVEDTKVMIETLQKLMKPKTDDDYNLGTDIMMENLRKEISLSSQEEMDEFLTNFPQNLANLNRTIELVEEREEELKDVPKTSSYMNNCMIEVLDQKTKNLNALEGKRYKPIKHFYSNIYRVYKERDSMDFLLDQVEPNIVYVRRILNDMKKERKNGRDGKTLTTAIMQNVQKGFCSVFKLEQMRLFELHVKKLIKENISGDVELTSFLFNYLLYIIYSNEKDRRRGYHKWVEALIMNVLDIESGNYDLPKDAKTLEGEIIIMIKDMLKRLDLL